MKPETIELFQKAASEHTLTIEAYIQKYPELPESTKDYIRRYHERLDYKVIVQGMLHWPENRDPHNWSGPFEENYVYYEVQDYSVCPEKLKTPEQIFEAHKIRCKYDKHTYPWSVWERLGMGMYAECWKVYVDGTVCGRSQLSPHELQLVMSEMTPKERIQSERHYAYEISGISGDPWAQISTEKPYAMYMCGSDDTSHTAYFNDDNERVRLCKANPEFLAFVLANPNWYYIRQAFIFTN